MPTAIECLAPGFYQDDRAVAVLHQAPQPEINRVRGENGGIDLGPLVEINIEDAGQREAVAGLAEVNVEEFLERAATELFGMHAHLMGQALLLRRRGPRQRCHTRTSSSYGSEVSISCGIRARIATSSEARATRFSLSNSTIGFAAMVSLAMPSSDAVATK